MITRIDGLREGALFQSSCLRQLSALYHLKKAASGVLAIFPCSRTGKYGLRAKMAAAFPSASLRTGLDEPFVRPVVSLSNSSGHAFLNRPEASDLQRACGASMPLGIIIIQHAHNLKTATCFRVIKK